jgi:hypothetical protein
MNKALAIAIFAAGIFALSLVIFYGALHQLFFAVIGVGTGIALYPPHKRKNDYLKFNGKQYYPKHLTDAKKFNKN